MDAIGTNGKAPEDGRKRACFRPPGLPIQPLSDPLILTSLFSFLSSCTSCKSCLNEFELLSIRDLRDLRGLNISLYLSALALWNELSYSTGVNLQLFSSSLLTPPLSLLEVVLFARVTA
jgi:hypothetical protein